MKRDGHYPHQTQIDAYGNGGFRFAEMSHQGSILCLPSGMHAWPVSKHTDITLAALAPVFASAADIDVLFVGLGEDIAVLDPEVRRALKEHGIIVEAISTGGAVRTYNIMKGENRAVAAALVAVERARGQAGQARR